MSSDKGQEIARSIDALFHLLVDDAQEAAVLWASQANGFSRRNYIRAVFALVEGMIQIIKSSCLLFHDMKGGSVFSPEEIVLLKEEQASVKENGSVAIKNTKISLAPNFRFAMSCANKVFELNHEPNVGEQGWEEFKNAIKIRDRITHPSSPEDMEICEDDMSSVEKAMEFFRKETLLFIKNRKV